MTRRKCPRATLALAASAMGATPALAGDVTSTRLSGFPIEWTPIGRWAHSIPELATFPNNGNEGHTYDVVLPNNLVNLDASIEVDNLSGLWDIRLSGNTLTVLETLSASTGTLSDGTLSAGMMTMSGNITLSNVQASVDRVETQGPNPDIRIRNGSILTVTDELFLNGGDLLYGSNPSGFVSMLTDATLRSSGLAADISDVNVPIFGDQFTIRQEQNGALRIFQAPQTWGKVTLLTGDLVELSSPTLVVDDLQIVFLDNAVGASVVIRSDIFVNNTLKIETDSTGNSSPVILTGQFGAGSLSGGTISASVQFSSVQGLHATGNSTIGRDARVRNDLNLYLDFVTITGGGLLNSKRVFSTADDGNVIVRDGELLNGGLFSQEGPVYLGENGRINSTTGAPTFLETTWATNSNILPLNLADVDSIQFASDGKLITTGDASIAVPADLTGDIRLPGGDLKLAGTTELTLATIESNAHTLIISPDPWALSTPQMFSGVIQLLTSENATQEVEHIRFQGGDTILNGTIRHLDAFGNPANVRIVQSATLSGGTLDLDPPARFIQDGGSVGFGLVLTNAGMYLFRQGQIDVPGVRNSGTLQVNAPSVNSVVSIGKLVNDMDVQHIQGVVELQGPDLDNSGSWTAPMPEMLRGISGGIVRYPGSTGSAVFNNLGTIKAEPGAQLEFKVLVDSPGRTVADGGTVRFSGPLQQFDDATGELSGGTWTVRDNGKILFENQQNGRVRTLASLTGIEITTSSLAPDSPWSAIESVAGSVEVSNQSELDLTSSDSFGDLEIDPSGSVHSSEQVLRLPGDTSGRGVATRIVARNVTNRGVLAVSGLATIEAAAISVVDGGSLRGIGGTFASPLVTNTSGFIEPGAPDLSIRGLAGSIGTISIEGDFSQDVAGVLRIEVDAPPVGADRVGVSGVATLAGVLEVSLVNDYAPVQGETFLLLSASSISGAFGTVLADGFLIEQDVHEVRAVYVGACPADLARPYGSLDFSDIVSFLTLFGRGDPAVDLAPPFGVLDFSDVVSFLGSFGAGCP